MSIVYLRCNQSNSLLSLSQSLRKSITPLHQKHSGDENLDYWDFEDESDGLSLKKLSVRYIL